jgi:hypothetical protein
LVISAASKELSPRMVVAAKNFENGRLRAST